MNFKVLEVRFFVSPKKDFVGFAIRSQDERLRSGTTTGRFNGTVTQISGHPQISTGVVILRGKEIVNDKFTYCYFTDSFQISKLFNDSVLSMFDFVLNNRTKLKRDI